MASVTFSTLVGGNGQTYNDERYNANTNPGGLDNGGHVFNFVPMLGQSVVMAESAFNSLSDFKTRYLGVYASDTAASASVGNNPAIGALYFRTTAPQELRIFISGSWRGIGSYTVGDLRVSGALQANTFENILMALGNVSNTLILDIDLYNEFSFTVTADLTLSFNYLTPTAGTVTSFNIKFNRQAGVITFPTSVRWSGGGAAPAFTANRIQIVNFYSDNGGSTWYARHAVANAQL